MRRRRRHPRRPFGIVGQQQQAFTGLVQTSDGRDPRQCRIQKRIHRLPALFVRGRGHGSARFVEHEINPGSGGNRLTIHFNAIALQANPRLRIATDCALQPRPSGMDKIKCLGTGTIAELGKGASQTHMTRAFRAGHVSMLTERELRLRNEDGSIRSVPVRGSSGYPQSDHKWQQCRR